MTILFGGVLPLPLVRTERLEVVDSRGRVAVAVRARRRSGRQHGGRGDLGIYDRRARERITLALGESGPFLSSAVDGNTALTFGVDDPESGAVHPGSYVELLGPHLPLFDRT